MQYLFVLNVIKNKHGLTDEECKEFQLDPESMMKMSYQISKKRYTKYSQYHDYEIYNLSLLCHPYALLHVCYIYNRW